MNLEELQIFKKDNRGIIYNCDKVYFIVRKKGSVGADHTHEVPEILYLTKGEIELTVGDKNQIVKAPTKISIEPNIYHKVLALSDIEIIEDKDESKSI